MSKVNYSSGSQYYTTTQTSWCLNLLNLRDIEPDVSDQIIYLDSKYKNDPYRLAYDLYGNDKLWWIFMLVNKDTIIDPINDFKAGMVIRLPTAERVSTTLGI